MVEHDWYGLHGGSWGDLAPGAVSHPAKFPRLLIRRVYEHALEMGYVSPGDQVLDTFAGIGGGAADAMRYGMHWFGVELEPSFYELAKANIENWNRLYAGIVPRWGTATVVNGDSRFLRDLLASADMLITSPPYGEGQTRDRAPVQAGAISDMMSRAYTQDRQGVTPGNLAAMRARAADFDALLTSPPYMDVIQKGEGPGARHDHVSHSEANARKLTNAPEYGRAEGQLGRLLADSFWGAARSIMLESFRVIRPGGVAIYVLRDFVRKGKVVPFCDQWLALGKACGFVPLEYIRSWLVRTVSADTDLLGDLRVKTVQNKAMFRTLAERNGSPPIDFDVILVLRKPI